MRNLLIALNGTTDPKILGQIVQLVDLVVVLIEPRHIALPEFGGSKLKSAFVDGVVKGSLNFAMQDLGKKVLERLGSDEKLSITRGRQINLHNGAAVTMFVDKGLVATRPDLQDIGNTRRVTLEASRSDRRVILFRWLALT